MSQARRELEKRARNAILQEAFFRFESAINFGVMLILATVFSSFWWLFLLLGILIEGFIGFRTLRNPEINAQAVAHIFAKKFQPGKLNSRELRAKIAKAMEYLQQIETAIMETRSGPMRDRMKHTTEGMVDWVEGVYRLAARLDVYQNDTLIKQDLKAVPAAIRELRKRLIETDHISVKEQIQKTIRDREDQFASLKDLEETMENADLLLERNLSDMGRIYSQILLMSSLKETSGKGEALQTEISEHVNQLDDLVQAMDEFQTGRATYQYDAIEQASY